MTIHSVLVKYREQLKYKSIGFMLPKPQFWTLEKFGDKLGHWADNSELSISAIGSKMFTHILISLKLFIYV